MKTGRVCSLAADVGQEEEGEKKGERIIDTYFANENTNSILKNIMQHSSLRSQCKLPCNFMQQWCSRAISVLVTHPPLFWPLLEVLAQVAVLMFFFWIL